MRIGIDGRELLNQRTGVGRYLAALCAQWLTLPDQKDGNGVPRLHTDLRWRSPT